ncbi:helix-turn-helix domain-containing protein [Rickettsiales bacterium]|nr:helix-turn-helix domain-containing protein [Rickettsiales bacterium]
MTLSQQTNRGLKDKAAAQYLGVSRSFLQKTRCTGQGGPKFIRVGRAVVYLREDLDAWLDQFHKADNIASLPFESQKSGGSNNV